jgi:nucleoid-associated protein YgaU
MGIFDRKDDKNKDQDQDKDRNRGIGIQTGSGTGKADFSNVRSGSSSTAPSPGTDPTHTYVVKKGDSLSKIAKHIYGDAGAWRRIFEANRDQIQDPDLIQPGQKLTIPAA